MSEHAAQARTLLRALEGRDLELLGVDVGQAYLTFTGNQCVTLGGVIYLDDVPTRAQPQTLDGLALLLPLLNDAVAVASAEDNGRLLLTVGDRTIRCGPDAEYEAWQYNSPDGTLVVCLPGGGLSIWSSG